MKRRRQQEHDEEIAREQADARRAALLAELKAHEAAGRQPDPAPEPMAETVADETPAPEAADEEPSA
jgi:hypothetical protein